MCIGAAVTVHRILVRVLPPKDCFKIRVSLESRYGINTAFDPLVGYRYNSCQRQMFQILSWPITRLTFFEASPNLLMTAPSESRDLLMFDPSFRVFPLAPVLFCRSDPTVHSIKEA